MLHLLRLLWRYLHGGKAAGVDESHISLMYGKLGWLSLIFLKGTRGRVPVKVPLQGCWVPLGDGVSILTI